MNRQNQKIREITFSGQDAMLLIPPVMLKEAVALCRKSPEALLILDEFFPTGLREYLMQVLEANRHLSLFSGSILPAGHTSGDSPIPGSECADDLFALILLQLSGLKIDRRLWFSELEYGQTPDRIRFLHMKYTPEARDISREGGLFLCRTKGCGACRTEEHKKGGISFILDPA